MDPRKDSDPEEPDLEAEEALADDVDKISEIPGDELVVGGEFVITTDEPDLTGWEVRGDGPYSVERGDPEDPDGQHQIAATGMPSRHLAETVCRVLLGILDVVDQQPSTDPSVLEERRRGNLMAMGFTEEEAAKLAGQMPEPGDWVSREAHEAALEAADERAYENWKTEQSDQEKAEQALFTRGVEANERQADALEALAAHFTG